MQTAVSGQEAPNLDDLQQREVRRHRDHWFAMFRIPKTTI